MTDDLPEPPSVRPPAAKPRTRAARRAWAVFCWWCGGWTVLSGLQYAAMDGAAVRADGSLRHAVAWGQLIPFGQGFLTIAHLLWFGRASTRAALGARANQPMA